MTNKKFIKHEYDNGNAPTIIRLRRKQLETMAQMLDNFKDIDVFELHIKDDHVELKFTLNLDYQFGDEDDGHND